MNIYSIRFLSIDNLEQSIKDLLSHKFRELQSTSRCFGWIEERTFTTPEGKVVVEYELITGTPTERWRESLKKAGLLDKKFDF